MSDSYYFIQASLKDTVSFSRFNINPPLTLPSIFTPALPSHRRTGSMVAWFTIIHTVWTPFVYWTFWKVRTGTTISK